MHRSIILAALKNATTASDRRQALRIRRIGEGRAGLIMRRTIGNASIGFSLS